MKNTVYPIIASQTSLPFYLTGIGISEPEYHIIRESGLISHQLLYTTGGEGVLNVGGVSYVQKKGSLFYLPPTLPHEYFPKDNNWTTCWVVFRGAFAKQLLGELGFSGAACVSDADTDKLDVLFKRLLSAANEPVAHERSSALLSFKAKSNRITAKASGEHKCSRTLWCVSYFFFLLFIAIAAPTDIAPFLTVTTAVCSHLPFSYIAKR